MYLLARINLANEVSRGRQPFSKSYKTSEKGCSILHAWTGGCQPTSLGSSLVAWEEAIRV